MDRNVLIIKTGYSEILEYNDESRKVSLGDILRTTPILHIYKDDNVTWVTDKSAFPLLENNSYIDNILPLDFWTATEIQNREFDILINLEKNKEICKFIKKIEAWRKYGFRYKKDSIEAYDKSFEVLAVSSNPEEKMKNKRTSQDLLFAMVGEKWCGEEYILGYNPLTEKKYDVGLNTLIGEKWPTKAWPSGFWDELERKLVVDGLKVARQDKQPKKILTDLNAYMDWINSCETIISNDSLGLHLGIAFKKNVLGLFGPTPHKEVHFYNRGSEILPENYPSCAPCFKGSCERGNQCIEEISVEEVYQKFKEIKR